MKRALSLILLAGCGGGQKNATPPPVAEPVAEAPPPAAPPAARVTTRRDNVVDMVHGVSVPDPYRWLEKPTDPDAARWMDEEDARARKVLAALPAREALAKRLTELTYIESMGVPTHEANRFFYTRSFADKEKAIYYVREGDKGTERALLDPNGWSEDGSVVLQGTYPSRDGKLVAWRRSENNADDATLFVRDVATGQDLPDKIVGARYAVPYWTKDSKGFYYRALPVDPSIPAADLPGKSDIRYHRLGTDPAQDPVIFPALNDASRYSYAVTSRDGKWLFLHLGFGWRRNDIYFRPLGATAIAAKGDSTDPLAQGFKKLIAGQDASYDVTAYNGRFYVHTNERAPRGRVFVIDPRNPAREAWTEIVSEPTEPGATINDVDLVGGRLIVTYLRNVASDLEIRGLDGKLVRKVQLPGLGTVSGLSGDPDQDTAYFRFSSPSFIPQIWKTSIKTGKSELWQEIKYPADLSPYVTDQVWIESKDKTKVPMFVIHRKDMVKNGENPVLLYGYGGFNLSMTAGFVPSWVVWLENGGVVALPSLRGGGELGEDWHRAGMLERKQNVFDDFAAAAAWLTTEKISRPGKIGINGGSNGGLLVGALMVQHPELIGAVVCEVPLLDMVRYHLFGSGKTWIEEYGSAEDPAQFSTLFAYSPYHHVKQGVAYPPLLMLSADSDDRVDPMHARKFVAQIQWATDRPESALIRIESKAGHGGSDMRKKNVEKRAEMYAWLLATLNR